MFIYQPSHSKETENTLDKIKNLSGVIPPHWELLALIAPKRFEMFIVEIKYLLNHPNINPDFFAMLRLHVANKEDIETIPLDDKHKLLAQKAIKAMYHPKEFTMEDITELKDISWTKSDIYDAIDHAAFLFKFAKIIQAYSA